MKIKLLEPYDIVARVDMSNQYGCILFVVIYNAMNSKLVPITHIDSSKGYDFTYLNFESYPSAIAYKDGRENFQAVGVVGKMNSDFTVTLHELPK